ncbi:hypothetical protein BDR26DRAFT_932342 [Obelidium mucronatum]|nr:hypothetical protein BDR26DRAFT_932342 [Obelidium mucronatum]
MLLLLPPEVAQLVFGFVADAASLARVGAASRVLRAHVRCDRLWRRVCAAQGYEAPPPPGLSPRDVAVLAAKTRCDRCGRRATKTNWPTFEKLCSKTHAEILPNPVTLLDSFPEWSFQQSKIDLDRTRARLDLIAHHKASKRTELIDHFSKLPSTTINQTTAYILDLCPPFKRICSAKSLVSNRVFQNARAVLEPEIKRVRIEQLADDIFKEMCTRAFLAVPTWAPAPFCFNQYNGYLRSVGTDVAALYLTAFKDMAWNDPLPVADVTVELNRLQNKLVRPFRSFQVHKQTLLRKYPDVSSMMILFQSHWVTAIKELFAETILLSHQEQYAKFDALFNEYMIQYRLIKLFPNCHARFASPYIRISPNQRRLFVEQNGVLAWFLKHPGYFDYKNPIWYQKYNDFERDAHAWIQCINQTRIALKF